DRAAATTLEPGVLVIEVELEALVEVPVDACAPGRRVTRGRARIRERGAEAGRRRTADGVVVDVQLAVARPHRERAPGAVGPAELGPRREAHEGCLFAGQHPAPGNLAAGIREGVAMGTARLGRRRLAVPAEQAEL